MMVSLAKFMDKSEITSRSMKIESMQGFNSKNEDSWTVFPNCDDCNPNHKIVKIPNNDPVIESYIVEFPNCEKCNESGYAVAWEKII